MRQKIRFNRIKKFCSSNADFNPVIYARIMKTTILVENINKKTNIITIMQILNLLFTQRILQTIEKINIRCYRRFNDNELSVVNNPRPVHSHRLTSVNIFISIISTTRRKFSDP